MNKVLQLLLIISLFNYSVASAQSWLWAMQGTGSLKSGGNIGNIATNKTGNVYQVGGDPDPITFGHFTINGGGGFLVKYDPNGDVIWADYLSSSINFVATDDSDNSYVYRNDGELVKYNSIGNTVWTASPNSHNTTSNNSVATDIFGNVYVATDYKGFSLAKCSRNGNIIWNTTSINNFTNRINRVATDIFGNVYLSGVFKDSINFGNYKLYSSTADVFIAKFDSNGNVLWAQQSYNAFTDRVYSVAADKSGAAYVTGLSANGTSFFLVKYNPSGSIDWYNESISISGTWGSSSICTDDSDHIYISGAQILPQDGAFIFENETFRITNATTDYPSFLIKLDSSGLVICGTTIDGGGQDLINYVTSDATGKFVYLGGLFDDVLAFGNNAVVRDHTGGPDPYIGRWKSCFECDLAVTTNASQASSICIGRSINLIASGGLNYTWSPSTGLSTTTGSSVLANPTITTTYNVSTSLSGCLEDSEQFVVNVNSLTIKSQSALICSGQSDILIASGGTIYTWSPLAGLNTASGDTVIANPTISTTYTATGIDSLGCTVTGLVFLNVIPSPNKPSFYQHGDTLISSAIHDNQWYRNDTLLPGDTSQYLIITILGQYWVNVLNEANGCSSTSDTTNITSLTGISQLSTINNQISIYPNPFSNDIFIKINSSAEDVKDWSLQITDVLGRPVSTISSLKYNNDINLSKLSTGVYFITIVNKINKVAVPLIKQ